MGMKNEMLPGKRMESECVCVCVVTAIKYARVWWAWKVYDACRRGPNDTDFGKRAC